MIVAITGSPGTGKTAVAESLAVKGYAVLDLMDIARTAGALEPMDDVDEVDVEAVALALPPPTDDRVRLVESTWAHLLPVDATVVLRCSPAELEKRLAAKGWSPDRVRSAMEGEAVDVIAVEVLESGVPAWEVDTTGRSVGDVADEVDAVLRKERNGSPPGTADWSEDVLEWY